MDVKQVGNFSDGLFCMEQRGFSVDEARELALLFFNWGVAACVDRLRPTRPMPSDVPPVTLEQLALVSTDPTPKTKHAPKKALHRIPEDMAFSPELRKFAHDRAFTPTEIENMWTKFFNHYLANGETAVNWESKWRTWVMRGVEYKNRDQGQNRNRIDDRL